MKKTIILSIIVILAISLMVFAKGALKVDFYPGGQWDGSMNGFVIVNRTPGGATETTVQIQIWDAQPETTYTVRSGYAGGAAIKIGVIETNKQGKGSLHLNLPSDTVDDVRDYIGIFTFGPLKKYLEANIQE